MWKLFFQAARLGCTTQQTGEHNYTILSSCYFFLNYIHLFFFSYSICFTYIYKRFVKASYDLYTVLYHRFLDIIIIKMIGVYDDHIAYWLRVLPASFLFLCTFLAVYSVDKIGRKFLLLASLGGKLVQNILIKIIYIFFIYMYTCICKWWRENPDSLMHNNHHS